jgi:hypothetical protein
MKWRDSLAMLGEFVELRRNPEFHSRTSLSSSPPLPTTTTTAHGPPSRQRRHSVNITVGTEDTAENTIHPRTYSLSRSSRPADASDDTVSLNLPQGDMQQLTRSHHHHHHRLDAYLKAGRRSSEPLHIGFPLRWSKKLKKKGGGGGGGNKPKGIGDGGGDCTTIEALSEVCGRDEEPTNSPSPRSSKRSQRLLLIDDERHYYHQRTPPRSPLYNSSSSNKDRFFPHHRPPILQEDWEAESIASGFGEISVTVNSGGGDCRDSS